MLEDRSYMRGSSPWQSQRSVTVILLIVNAVVFVIHHVLKAYNLFPVEHFFALSREGLGKGWIWQLLSFQFLHGGLLHILLNSWGIYVFGRAVEDALGRGRFLTLYFGSGAVGGLVQVLGGIVFPLQFGGPAITVVGASAGLFGLIGAFGRLFPHERLTLLLFFILPITLTGQMLMIISGVIAFVGIIIPSQSGIAEGAHLGGLLAGLAYIQWFRHSEFNASVPAWIRKWKPPHRSPRPKRMGSNAADKGFDQDEFTPDFITKEVDPILDKISEHGIQSLTERERRILEAARARMAKR